MDIEVSIETPIILKQGAEAKIFLDTLFNRPVIIKERFSKKYRHPELDRSLTAQRMKSEIRSIMRCKINGIKTPAVYFVDMETNKIYMEYIQDPMTVRDFIKSTQKEYPSDYIERVLPLAAKIGSTLGLMHAKNIIHGDLTTSNMLLQGNPKDLNLYMIDFGLGYIESVAEDKGVDIYVLERALLSTHPNTEQVFETILEHYKSYDRKGCIEVIKKFEEVRLRGRKRTMVG